MNRELTFLFYHYGKIPKYLRNAVEQVRLFNPQAEIMVVTDGISDISLLAPFDVRHHKLSEFPSDELDIFRRTYRHISCFKERYERFVLERWFVTETIRRERSERIYIMQDSDVAVFGDASALLPLLPDCPIGLSGNNPHFTFILSDISDFLRFILAFYADETRIAEGLKRHAAQRQSTRVYNVGEMQFLFDYRDLNKDMRVYLTDTPVGYIDVNIHIPEGFDFMRLRRRPRKKVFWRRENGRLVPYFRKDGLLVRAFLVHFQGPGKRVFWRFGKQWRIAESIRLPIVNLFFQQRSAANLT